MKRAIAAALVAIASPAAAGSVAGSKHDFSAKGPGLYRAVAERSPCIFCHVSHGSGPMVLSNRPDTVAEHRPYESSTMKGRPGAPTGSSRLCLSCHDGTIAVGQTRNGVIQMLNGSQPIPPDRRSNIGTDLRKTHPVSVTTPVSPHVRAPPKGDAVALDRSGMVQCTSCHDPHDEWRDPDVGKFLVKKSARSALCLSCHAGSGVGRSASATHLSSSATCLDPQTGKTRTMAEVGCGLCHVPHAADVRGRLVKPAAADSEVCLGCHGASAQKRVSVDLDKASAHFTRDRGRHDAGEGPDAPDGRRLPEVSPGAPRHVTCVDCHDPHASNAAPALAPAGGGALAGAWGIALSGDRVAPARYEYEVCFKCHADSANQPQSLAMVAGDRVRRAYADLNLRLVFASTAVSFHPVAAPGKNPSVPSLRRPYSPASLILCTDCHASDSGPGAGGSGARGPHGSVYSPILERQYLTGDLTAEGPDSYALCYKCHDREILLSDASSFRYHRLHVVQQSAPCSACHVAHGVSRDAGRERANDHLVSFDLSIVKPGRTGAPQYESRGSGHGSCALTCHHVPHGPGSKPSSY